MSSIFNKFKDLDKGVECALNTLLVINQAAHFCDFIKDRVRWQKIFKN